MGQCPASHRDDESPCSGPILVMVLDAQNHGSRGCTHHAGRLLASLDGGRCYGLPEAPRGTCLRVFLEASKLRPFSWLAEAGQSKAPSLRSMLA